MQAHVPSKISLEINLEMLHQKAEKDAGVRSGGIVKEQNLVNTQERSHAPQWYSPCIENRQEEDKPDEFFSVRAWQ